MYPTKHMYRHIHKNCGEVILHSSHQVRSPLTGTGSPLAAFTQQEYLANFTVMISSHSYHTDRISLEAVPSRSFLSAITQA